MMHENILLSTWVCIYTQTCREDFLGKEGLDHIQDCRKENSRDYSTGKGRTGNLSGV